jgi:hypothetical protein
MWQGSQDCPEGDQRFFLMGVSHDTLYNHYETNFYLSKMHEFSISEIDNMLPFEREVYLAFVKKFVEEEKKQMQEMKNKARR